MQAVSHDQGPPPPVGPAEDKAGRSWKRSLYMLPAIIGSAIVSAIVSVALLSQRGLEGSEPMSVQGSYGRFVLILGNLVILLAPAYAGLFFGIRAVRKNGGRRAVVAAGLHGVIIIIVWVAVLRAL